MKYFLFFFLIYNLHQAQNSFEGVVTYQVHSFKPENVTDSLWNTKYKDALNYKELHYYSKIGLRIDIILHTGDTISQIFNSKKEKIFSFTTQEKNKLMEQSSKFTLGSIKEIQMSSLDKNVLNLKLQCVNLNSKIFTNEICYSESHYYVNPKIFESISYKNLNQIYAETKAVPLYQKTVQMRYFEQIKEAVSIEEKKVDCHLFEIDTENKEVLEGAF